MNVDRRRSFFLRSPDDEDEDDEDDEDDDDDDDDEEEASALWPIVCRRALPCGVLSGLMGGSDDSDDNKSGEKAPRRPLESDGSATARRSLWLVLRLLPPFVDACPVASAGGGASTARGRGAMPSSWIGATGTVERGIAVVPVGFVPVGSPHRRTCPLFKTTDFQIQVRRSVSLVFHTCCVLYAVYAMACRLHTQR